ncbi:AraC family transcriptional regulator [Afipia sp. P52-10]|jgi:AraC-like DNA-binding protein|uniref:AraC family transcriptional regulator n=1 Tax=Afipia sp. P52-10 TaxID=1429916 RepID=UPI0003DF16BA|nr:helix-turn-helix transcriptional regulator [Afipia sp. P52-10]ETR78331.1 AraC family transcriptional regulator [Afipia sp. P52-10]
MQATPAPALNPVTLLAVDDQALPGQRHSHAEAQLLYAVSGVFTVATDRGVWVVPPNRAVWVPAGVEHITASSGPIKFRALFVAAGAERRLPDDCCVVEVSPLLREMIVRLASIDGRPEHAAYALRLSLLLLDELTILPVQPLSLPMPRHPRLAAFCAAVQADPAHAVVLEEAAARLGVSRRSFMRLFLRETGMTFGRWHQQARLLDAQLRLAQGHSILSVALDCGYQSPSAFAAAFRRALGKAPSEYFAR